MRKSNLKDGTPILVIKVEHYVQIDAFCVALTDHYYRNSLPFDNKLKRNEAMGILKRSLFFHGIAGEYSDGFFEASFELSEQRNAIFEKAKQWVAKNYPYLKQ